MLSFTKFLVILNDHLQAEEDAAAVRAEIKLLQANEDQSESVGAMADQLRLAEQHNNALQKELQVIFIQMYFVRALIPLFVYSS